MERYNEEKEAAGVLFGNSLIILLLAVLTVAVLAAATSPMWLKVH